MAHLENPEHTTGTQKPVSEAHLVAFPAMDGLMYTAVMVGGEDILEQVIEKVFGQSTAQEVKPEDQTQK